MTLSSLDYHGTPAANEFLPHVWHFLVPTWYRQLRILTRNHIESGEAPILSLALKPETNLQWQTRQQIVAEMRNEADTFGLIETGNIGGEFDQPMETEIDLDASDIDEDY